MLHKIFREKEIDANYAKMEKEIAAWQSRLDSRKKLADREIERQRKILAEVFSHI